MPSAGKRTELIFFQREKDTRRPGGGSAASVDDIGQAWSAVTWIRGGESDRQGALREIAVYRFTVLSAAIDALTLTAKDRLIWNGETYNIRERPRRLPNKPETEIIAEAGVTQ